MRRVAVLLCGVGLLAACATDEGRPSPVAGSFAMSNARHGASRVLAPLPREGDVPLVRLADSGAVTLPLPRWRFTRFAQGSYRVSGEALGAALSLAADYRVSPGAVGLAPSRKSASQLWFVEPLGDGHCRLRSVLFPDRSLGLDEADAGTPRLSVTADEPAQRWRLEADGASPVDGLPSLCGGGPSVRAAAPR